MISRSAIFLSGRSPGLETRLRSERLLRDVSLLGKGTDSKTAVRKVTYG